MGLSRAVRPPVARWVAGLAAGVSLALPVAGADPPAAGTAVPVAGLLQVVLALLLVLGAIGLFAWFMRRFVPGHGAAGGVLKVVGGVMVGPRERLVVVEVGDTWLFVGVAASSVRLVHSIPRPERSAAAPAPATSLTRRLRHALALRRGEG
jgi:flagellar protein FliO/FliZ